MDSVVVSAGSGPVVVTEAGSEVLQVLGSAVRVRLLGNQTGGAFSLFEINDAAGSGVPTHVHEREDETFHVLRGVVRFVCGGKTVDAGPGTTVFAPRNVPHSYVAVDGPSQMLMQVTPSGMEGMFRELAALAGEQRGDMGLVVSICGRYGVRFV